MEDFEFLAIWMNIHFAHVFCFFTSSHPMQGFVATTRQRVWEQIVELGTILEKIWVMNITHSTHIHIYAHITDSTHITYTHAMFTFCVHLQRARALKFTFPNHVISINYGDIKALTFNLHFQSSTRTFKVLFRTFKVQLAFSKF